jgi:predicted transglutaminase-like cysteine proteinase
MRPKWIVLAAGAVLTLIFFQQAEATFDGFPRLPKGVAQRLLLDEPSLAPIAHTRFCLQYPSECKVRRLAFRGGSLALTVDRWSQLVHVNHQVNGSILPQRNHGGVWEDVWTLAPRAGDCNDYAVTKRHVLLARGWPSRSLLLAEVEIFQRKRHLVLVARTAQGDFVLDNLNESIRPWSRMRYRWLRIQSPMNPNFWSTLKGSKGET